MLFFPLPFLTAFFLMFVIIQLNRYWGRGSNWVIVLTLAGFGLQSVLLGLSWGGHSVPKFLIVSVALVLPPLAWLSLNELAARTGPHSRLRLFGFTLATLVGVNAAFFSSETWIVDIASIVIYLCFGSHLIWLAFKQDLEWMALRPLQALVPTQRAYLFAGATLVLSAGVDVIVALDIRFNESQISPALVGYSNLAVLLILVCLFFIRHESISLPSLPSRDAVNPAPKIPRPVPGSVQDSGPSAEEIIEKLDLEMETNHLYRNESLSLNEIARRIRVPARQVSSAVNTLRAMNVPKYVNTFRIRDACRILQETDMPVTEIVFAVGFTTKSNFNREFQRMTGLNPSAWRNRAYVSGGVGALQTDTVKAERVTSKV